jgi:hypothetical protein
LAKYKKIIWIALAAVFVIVLFLIKSETTFENKDNLQVGDDGLIYSKETLETLVTKDGDGDGILDWQENLYGLDPTKKETTPGIKDEVAIAKLKSLQNTGEEKNVTEIDETKLTETEKFSRELFSTIATLNQSGNVDQATIDKLSDYLTEKIKNPISKKIYTLNDVKKTNNDTVQSTKKYYDILNSIYAKYNTSQGVPEVLEKLVANEEDMSVLEELNPIINQIDKIIKELLKVEVPPAFLSLHLELVNNSQRLLENISDLKLIGSDPLVAITAISQYWENTASLELVAGRLEQAISQKLTQQ